ncbi:hypothetical protein [Mesorhizobium sp. ES1-4]|uniref:hypothetical protein n=1 Tax=Mesorhizobium sp. ES1-4 TaxID=2876627 RepID=UPI001CCAD241|nr:hypothetical protein [Mesorhizobium sp. ES1-4]MBZ9800098.1 hypothetical protein [Mesorhizobium sp. ES1-4]
MSPHLVCVGGVDHHLRIPFLAALRERDFRVTALSGDDGSAFLPHGIPHRRFGFDRFTSGRDAWSALRSQIDDHLRLHQAKKTRPRDLKLA